MLQHVGPDKPGHERAVHQAEVLPHEVGPRGVALLLQPVALRLQLLGELRLLLLVLPVQATGACQSCHACLFKVPCLASSACCSSSCLFRQQACAFHATHAYSIQPPMRITPFLLQISCMAQGCKIVVLTLLNGTPDISEEC